MALPNRPSADPQPPSASEDMAQDSLIAALRGSAPYIHAHRGRTFVLVFGGEAARRGNFANLMYDIALLHSLGVRIVLVHGARPQIDDAIKAAGLTPQIVDNVRVTDDDALACVKSAVGALRMEIESLLSTGLASTPMAGARLRVTGGNLVTAKPMGVLHGVDHRHTGEVRRVDTQAIEQALQQGQLVLLSPVGYSPTGEIFNLFAENVAAEAAKALRADKLVFLHEDAELHVRHPDCPPQLQTDEAVALLNDNAALTADERAHLAAAVDVCRHGVRRTHLVSSAADGALLRELYTRDGAGTLISADSYDTLRQAGIEDAGSLMALIQPLQASGALVPRTPEQLELEIDRYAVMLRDGMIIACCALMPYPEQGTGELACVAVHPDYRHAGRAERLLAEIEKQARAAGLSRIFVLTTKATHWFVERGFLPAQVSDLPLARQQLYNFQRNSKVLIKTLA